MSNKKKIVILSVLILLILPLGVFCVSGVTHPTDETYSDPFTCTPPSTLAPTTPTTPEPTPMPTPPPPTVVTTPTPTPTPTTPTTPTTPEPIPEPTPTPTIPTTPEPVGEPTVTLSEGNSAAGMVGVIADIEAPCCPFEDWELTLDGPGVFQPEPTQYGTLDADGSFRVIWQANVSGDYSVSGTVGDTPVSSDWLPITVVPPCFAYDTLVLMADNSLKYISDMQVGDMVQTYDVETGQTLIAGVTATNNGEADYYYLINGNLKVTPPHPFFTAEGQWTKVVDLKVGDKIRSIQGQVEITSIEEVNSGQRIYNISVRDFHNFFVSADGKDFYLVQDGLPEDR